MLHLATVTASEPDWGSETSSSASTPLLPPHLVPSPPGHLVRDCAQCGRQERPNKIPPLKRNKNKILKKEKKIQEISGSVRKKNDVRDDWSCDQLRAAGAWAASACGLVPFRCMRLHVLGQEVGTGALAQRHNISVVLVPTEGKKKQQNKKNAR